MIDAMTIGPIPSEITDPNSVARIIERYSNLEREFAASPKRGMFPRTKKNARIMRVHLSFVLKASFFSMFPVP